MSGFLYYHPERNLVAAADMRTLGLAYAFEETVSNCPVHGTGPTGKNGGVLFANPATIEPGLVGFHASKQRWRQLPGSPIWCGMYTADRPTPADLVRPDALNGHEIELADALAWMIPLARGLREHESPEALELRYQIRLPQTLDLATDGKWVATGILPRYAALWEIAEGWATVRWGQGEPHSQAAKRFDDQGAIDAAVLALQANYRIGRIEAAMLGLLTDPLVNAVLDLLIDMPTFTTFVKKKRERDRIAPPAGSNSSAGPAAEIPATGQPSPT